MNPYPFVGLNHFTVPMAISIPVDDGAQKDAAQRFDLASFVDVEVTRRGEFSCQPFELGLDPLALLVAQKPFEQRHGAAQSAQADAHLMHTFGVQPSHCGFVGRDVAQY
jgi:hypothetical protein